MRHRQPTTLSSRAKALLRPLGALVLAAGVASTVLAAAGGAENQRDVGLDVVQIARQQLGDAYTWGGNGPDSWDCSGLTSRLWREVGKVSGIPRVSRDQQAWAVPIPREQLLPGDLVFFGNPVNHVGIYAGDGVMVDASSARKGVIERPLYQASVVRYGRVPRPDMPAVQPWAAPEPSPSASPTASPSAAPSASPSASPSPSPSASPSSTASARAAAKSAAAPSYAGPAVAPSTSPITPLLGLPQPNLGAPHAIADLAARNAKTVTGSKNWDDLALVQVAWHHSGGRALPASRTQIEKLGAPVPLGQVRRGDVVLYGSPASHLGIYLGWGYMVDASPSLGRVVVRRVFDSPTVHFVRLPVR